MIIRDLLFYLVGYIFGVKGMTTHESIILYKRMQAENKLMALLRAKKEKLLQKERDG